MIVPLTVVWMIMSITGYSSTTSIRYSQQAEGWKCCMDSQALTPSACSLNKQESNFTPPIIYSNRSEAPTGLVWTPRSLKCPWGFEITYYNLTKFNKLILEEDTIKLQWLDVMLFKRTTDFCVERFPKEIVYRAAVCQPHLNTICNNATCVIKCCDPEEAEKQPVGCLSSNLSLDYKSISGSPADPPTDQVVISSVPPCGSIVFRHSYEYYLLTDGSLYEPETSITYDSNSYCLATKYQKNFGAFVCPRLPSKIAKVKDYFQTVGVMISAIFLTLTIIFHIFIPSLRDMQGLCFLCHMSSLLVADLSLFTAYVYTLQLSKIHCFVHGIILQFSFLAVFFWLNVMCFDIWRVIRATAHSIPLTGILASDGKKFKLYSVYAWGGPMIITVAGIILHTLPKVPAYSHLIRPRIGEVSCWLPSDKERLAHFYGIVALLFVMNMLLLGHTVIMLYKAGSAFRCFASQVTVSAFNRNHLEGFWQRLTLFILMALCWVTEALSWKFPAPEIWFPTDVLNSLQGFIVFLIFINSKKKREMVKETLNGAVNSVSSAARKLSKSEDLAATWHVNTSSLSFSMNEEELRTKKSLTESQEELSN